MDPNRFHVLDQVLTVINSPTLAWKIIYICSLLVMVTTVLLTHMVGTLYPIFVIGSAVIFCLLIFGVFYSPPRSNRAAIFTILIALLLRLHVVWFEPTPYAIDPYAYIGGIERFLIGGIDAIGLEYYDKAPLFLVIAGIFSLLTDLTPGQAYVIHSIIVAIGIPVTGAVIYKQVANNPTPGDITVAVILITSIDRYANYVYLPIANTYALIILFILLSAVIIYLRLWNSSSDRLRCFLLIIVLNIGMFFSHKLAQFIFLASLCVVVVHVLISKYEFPAIPRSEVNLQAVLGIVLVIGVYLFVHSLFVTDLMRNAISILLIGIENFLQPPPDTRVTSGYSRFIHRSYLNPLTATARGSLLAVLFGIPATAFAFYNQRRTPVQIYAIFAGISLLLGVAGASELERFVTSSQLILVVFIVVVSLHIYRQDNIFTQYFIPGALAFFIITNMLSAPAVIGYADMADRHRTPAEVQGLEWTIEYYRGSVFTDRYTAYVLRRAGDPDSDRLKSAQPYYFSGGFIGDRCPPAVLHRTGYETHWGPGMIRVIWSPEDRLDRVYDRTYSNGAADLYINPDCNLQIP